jgi:hypothetical protein
MGTSDNQNGSQTNGSSKDLETVDVKDAFCERLLDTGVQQPEVYRAENDQRQLEVEDIGFRYPHMTHGGMRMVPWSAYGRANSSREGDV